MLRWYLVKDEAKNGARAWYSYGKGGARIPWLEMTDDWVRENGFRTRPAAVQMAGGNYVLEHDNSIRLCTINVEETGLRYKIYKCYEIVIEDSEGNAVGESNYCYGSKADAEDMARHELKLAMMEKEGR